jgi:hypothetical protein
MNSVSSDVLSRETIAYGLNSLAQSKLHDFYCKNRILNKYEYVTYKKGGFIKLNTFGDGKRIRISRPMPV